MSASVSGWVIDGHCDCDSDSDSDSDGGCEHDNTVATPSNKNEMSMRSQ